jgi:GT2 family glycosyltransferase
VNPARAPAGAPLHSPLRSGPAPIVLVPLQSPTPSGLDACLAALDRTLPDAAPVLIADDACADPRVVALASGWCERTRLGARYLRREQPLGLAANVAAALAEPGDADFVLLRSDAEPTPGWLPQMQRAAAAAPRAATVAAWSGEGELASFVDPAAANANAIAEAAASLDWPEPLRLPAAAGPALLLRRAALRQLGGLDVESFAGWCALDDLCRRADALGWSNLLCASAYVARAEGADGGGTLGEIERLQARWPDFQERVARFILEDALRPLRERLRARIAELARGGPQRDLFGH